MFKGILINKDDTGYHATIQDIDESQLPEGDVTIDVEYSTINYKDALAITGKSPIIRTFPLVPGVDLAGKVTQTSNPEFAVGDYVVLNGWGVGEKHWGGYAQKARLKGDWLIPLPNNFTSKQAMEIGTAGYTAMLCILALEKHGITPDKGEIVVSGSSGGVGSVAIALLSKLGYQVVAITGRIEEEPYLKSLGASEVMPRSAFSEAGRPLAKERWAGAVDTVGSTTLANICASTKYGGVVTACGLAGGMDFPATVAPFILRGVTLAGIDSVMAPKDIRMQAWQRLGTDLDISKLESLSNEIPLSNVIATAPDLLEGKVRGRLVVNVNT